MDTVSCNGCGTAHASSEGLVPDRCGSCPPEVCGECGGVNHIATDQSCACWVSLEGMPLADVKALFARDGTFSIDPIVEAC